MSLNVQSLSKHYQMGEVTVKALQNVSIDIEEGEFIVILGPSGCGKTTLLNLIGGIDRATNGNIVFQNAKQQVIGDLSEKQLTRYRRNQIGFIFQFYNLVGTLTAYENVLLAAKLTNTDEEAKKVTRELLDEVGLQDKIHKFPGQLSGGEQQRVSIARALAKRPKILLADEPTGNIDSETTRTLLKLFKKINQDFKVTMIIVTHNVGISYIADRVIYLRDGQIFGTSTHDPEKEAEFWESLGSATPIDTLQEG